MSLSFTPIVFQGHFTQNPPTLQFRNRLHTDSSTPNRFRQTRTTNTQNFTFSTKPAQPPPKSSNSCRQAHTMNTQIQSLPLQACTMTIHTLFRVLTMASLRYNNTHKLSTEASLHRNNTHKLSTKASLRNEHPPACLLYTSPSPRDMYKSRMPSSA